MHRVDTTTAVPALPAPDPVGTQGFFTRGDGGSTPATIPGPDWFNTIQEELIAVLTLAAITPDATKVNKAQVAAGIQSLITNAIANATSLPSASIGTSQLTGIDWIGPRQIDGLAGGTMLTEFGAQTTAMTALNGRDIAFAAFNGTAGNFQLRVYRFDGVDWSLLGTPLVIAGAAGPCAITRLSSSPVVPVIAFIDVGNDQLRRYQFDMGTGTWSQTGSGLTIAGLGSGWPALAALTFQDVAYIDSVNDSLRVYRWGGSSWSQLGSGLSIINSATPALTAFSTTDVAHVDSNLGFVRMYRWNGSAFTALGSPASIEGIGSNVALAALNKTDLVFIDALTESLQIFRFTGSSWLPIGNPLDMPPLSNLSMTSLNGTDVALYDANTQMLRYIRCDFSIGGGPHLL